MKILILTEGGRKFGFGHLTRCVALSQGFEKIKLKTKVMFILNGDKNAKDFLKKQDINPTNLHWIKQKRKVLSLAKEADLVIIDSYVAPFSFYSLISKVRFRLKPYIVAIDDYKRINYPVDMVINPSIYGNKLDYKSNSQLEPVYLLGGDYIILREEFWRVPPKTIRDKAKNILITFGGMGCKSFIKKLLNFLSSNFPLFSYHIVNNYDLGSNPHSNFKFYSALSALKMRNLMQKCDLCISAGGQTLYELGRTGVSTIGICFTENQELNLRTCADKGFVEYIGWFKDKMIFDRLNGAIKKLDFKKERSNKYRTARSTVDGLGVKRLVEGILANRMEIRAVTKKDCRNLWVWRNHSGVRRWCFKDKKIPFKQHQKWFTDVLNNKNMHMYIVENGKKEALGQIKLERNKTAAHINVNLNPKFFGRKLGHKIIQQATQNFLNEKPRVKLITAEVIKGNMASLKAFQKANYTFNGVGGEKEGREFVTLIYKNDKRNSKK